ncbi:MAG: helix-turn-helix transcriptional regulator [Pseudonocardiaceae bacterium]
MTDRLLTTKQVAERVGGVSESTVRYWRHTGYGPEGFRVGRRVLYPEAGVNQWISDLRAAEQTA